LVMGKYLFSKQAQPTNTEFTRGAKGED